jgi:NhaB family Na+:H+ antiporter
MGNVFFKNFLGDSPAWYKTALVFFLILNPILFAFAPIVAGWLLIAEFIFTLVMALKCYPLPAGGLLALEAVIIGMTSPETVYHEVAQNLPVLLLLMFMVAGIYFMKDGLLALFTVILLKVRSKILLSFAFCAAGAFLSAFLDALTVTAVIISVVYGFYGVYHSYVSNGAPISQDNAVKESHKADLEQFRRVLRNLLMHSAVGTALGGAMTLVGEPQNLIIGERLKWHFGDFFFNCMPVSVPVAIAGLLTCVLLEVVHFPGYGYKLPENVLKVLSAKPQATLDKSAKLKLFTQGLVGVLLIIALAFHVAEVGLIGLAVIIILTAFNGVINEHKFGAAFHDALPFTALLVVFFVIVAMINDLQLFKPIIAAVLRLDGQNQLLAFYAANGVLSMISDNVFVATIYINEVQAVFQTGAFDYEWFSKLAVAINMGTNIPSIVTPNGQAAFLFLLTSSLAPLIRLSYMEMVKLALPYSVVLVTVGAVTTKILL